MKKDRKVIVHVVQHLCPGGIEVLALNMHKHSKAQTFIVSLEGTKKKAIREWPALEVYKDNILFMNKKSGISLKTILKLCVLLRRLKADVVHTHHIGPLLYGGVAAKLTSIKILVH
ncbi:MAG: glycosyltransferase, partial [Alphaproteobacteria bacterium]|nr:glycosyltransferase [Alphaproteobacteria bacterium]